MNFPVILGSALIPTVIGFVWYNPKVFGNAWMKAADMTEEKMKGANMAIIFGVSVFLSILLSIQMNFISIHQHHVANLLMNDSSPEAAAFIENFMATYGEVHRTWTHGLAHGFGAGLFFALPVLGTNALFERKGFKYILVNAGYWTVTLMAMGAVLCQFA